MKKLTANYSYNGFDYNVMFASVNFSSDGITPLAIYEDETDKINEGDELCVIEKIYVGNTYQKTRIIERNCDPSNYILI